MSLSQERWSEIAKRVIKEKLKESLNLRAIGEYKKELGEISQKSGFSKKELTEFFKPLVQEAFEEQMRKGLSFDLEIS
ncbi:hypothetical protein KJ991_00605 [Patescibacteria group bacterium]|nr:hypothetical protein [Patescibacteria group bacterium]MBU4057537.1 hypothetical protein [Patescibacteria group bacterium]MBU4116083.1 hypothetical protein [Patescibacteria group bacterium]